MGQLLVAGLVEVNLLAETGYLLIEVDDTLGQLCGQFAQLFGSQVVEGRRWQVADCEDFVPT
ncbi:MAG: hypothetical protein AB7E55_27590 [Pigmentiphaga sp.]